MELQSIIVLIVAWLWVAVPAVYFIIKGCKGDCRKSEKRQTFWSAVGALAFATGICLWIYFGVTSKL